MSSAIMMGLALGLRHAIDPDHVVALTSLMARERRASTASWLGAIWGLGHGAVVVTLGAAAVLMGVSVPERFSQAAELGVALLLVGLGLGNLTHAYEAGVHPEPEARTGLRRALVRSGFVGVAHGLAGSGVVVVVAAAALPTPKDALAYLASFALATLLGMVVCSTLLSAPFARAAGAPRLHRGLHVVTGLASLLVGVGLGVATLRTWMEPG